MWKQRKGSNATYRNLMKVFTVAGHRSCADFVQEICMSAGECVYNEQFCVCIISTHVGGFDVNEFHLPYVANSCTACQLIVY